VTARTSAAAYRALKLLLAKGYVVHGVKRRASSFNTDRIDHRTKTLTRRTYVSRYTTAI
jgi:GDP-D-mannose dehydratase